MPRHLGYFHPDSKLITSDLERVKEYIRGSVDIMLQRNKQTVVHSLDEIRNAITREFEERFGQLEEHIHDEIHVAIEPIHDEINEIVNVQGRNHNEDLRAIQDVHEEQVQMHNDIEGIQNQIQIHANHMEEQIDQLNQQIQQLTMREQLFKLKTSRDTSIDAIERSELTMKDEYGISLMLELNIKSYLSINSRL